MKIFLTVKISQFTVYGIDNITLFYSYLLLVGCRLGDRRGPAEIKKKGHYILQTENSMYVTAGQLVNQICISEVLRGGCSIFKQVRAIHSSVV